jgi:hypothetical protein
MKKLSPSFGEVKRLMNKTNLERIIEEVTSRTLVGSVSIAIEKIAEEIAKEALADEEFRESLRALTRASARQIMVKLAAAKEANP